MLAGGAYAPPLDSAGLDRTLCHDAARGLLEVQAGVPWRSLQSYVGADFLPGSVGESVAANCAGPDGEPIVRHVHAFTLATANGELHRVSRERAADLFRLAVGGFGAFGPFYSLTLDLASLASSAARATAPARLELPDEIPGGQCFAIALLAPALRSDEVVDGMRAALAERRCRLRRLEARRILPEAETFLRWARGECVQLRIEFQARATIGACTGAAQLRARLIDLALAAGGAFTPEWLPLATRAQAEAGYPMLGAFLAEKHRLDPAERVQSPWYRGTRRIWRAESCAVRWARD
jgi:FAD/FMN-containing dehydrogenase